MASGESGELSTSFSASRLRQIELSDAKGGRNHARACGANLVGVRNRQRALESVEGVQVPALSHQLGTQLQLDLGRLRHRCDVGPQHEGSGDDTSEDQGDLQPATEHVTSQVPTDRMTEPSVGYKNETAPAERFLLSRVARHYVRRKVAALFERGAVPSCLLDASLGLEVTPIAVDECCPLVGVSSRVKIASTGHAGTHAPQSMHSSGWM